MSLTDLFFGRIFRNSRARRSRAGPFLQIGSEFACEKEDFALLVEPFLLCWPWDPKLMPESTFRPLRLSASCSGRGTGGGGVTGSSGAGVFERRLFKPPT